MQSACLSLPQRFVLEETRCQHVHSLDVEMHVCCSKVVWKRCCEAKLSNALYHLLSVLCSHLSLFWLKFCLFELQ